MLSLSILFLLSILLLCLALPSYLILIIMPCDISGFSLFYQEAIGR